MAGRATHSVLAVGDVFLNRERPATAFGGVREQFDGADLRLGNLEAGFAGDRKGVPKGLFHLRSPPSTVDGLVEAGFDALSFANNHALDYGREALCEVVDTLEERGIGVAGAGKSLAAARRPVVRSVGDTTVGLVAFEATRITHKLVYQAHPDRPGIAMVSPNPLYAETHLSDDDLRTVEEVVSAAADAVDALVAMFHFGEIPEHAPTRSQRVLSRRAIDAGADAVVGAHPHVLQGVDTYRGAPVFYSLGHFVFDPMPESASDYPYTDPFPPISDATGMAELAVDAGGEITAASVLPAYIAGGRPEPLEPGDDEYRHVVDLLTRLSEREGTALEPDGGRLRVPLGSST